MKWRRFSESIEAKLAAIRPDIVPEEWGKVALAAAQLGVTAEEAVKCLHAGARLRFYSEVPE